VVGKVYPKSPEVEAWELRIQRNKTKGARMRENSLLRWIFVRKTSDTYSGGSPRLLSVIRALELGDVELLHLQHV
jgi:hypothetical protein